jgi:hypothetical protein
MTESDPFEDARRKAQLECKVQLRGPNVNNTLDTPLRPGAVEVQKAAIRKHLRDRHPRGDRPNGS